MTQEIAGWEMVFSGWRFRRCSVFGGGHGTVAIFGPRGARGGFFALIADAGDGGRWREGVAWGAPLC